MPRGVPEILGQLSSLFPRPLGLFLYHPKGTHMLQNQEGMRKKSTGHLEFKAKWKESRAELSRKHPLLPSQGHIPCGMLMVGPIVSFNMEATPMSISLPLWPHPCLNCCGLYTSLSILLNTHSKVLHNPVTIISWPLGHSLPQAY